MTPSVRTLQGGAKTKSFKGSSSLALGGQTRVAFPHRAYQKIGALEKERILTDVLEKEGVFPAKIKKFSILQGEERLNIFEDPTVLAELINMYSSIKDLAPYKDLSEYIMGKAKIAKQNSQDKRQQVHNLQKTFLLT